MLLEYRNYSEDDNRGSSGGVLGKAVLGTVATAGTLYGAKKGLLGTRLQMGTNIALGKFGQTIGSKSLVNSAREDWSRGAAKNVLNKTGLGERLTGLSGGDKIYENVEKDLANKFSKRFLSGKGKNAKVVGYNSIGKINEINEANQYNNLKGTGFVGNGKDVTKRNQNAVNKIMNNNFGNDFFDGMY